MGFLDELRYYAAANKQIKKKAQAEYFRAKDQEQMRVARERARIEADAKIRQMAHATTKSNGFLERLYGKGGILHGMTESSIERTSRKHRMRHKAKPRVRTKIVYVQARPPRGFY